MGWIPGYGSLYMVHPFISAPNSVSVAPSMGALLPRGTLLHWEPSDPSMCEHPLLCLLGPSIVSHETAISGSFQQNLASVCNGVSVWG